MLIIYIIGEWMIGWIRYTNGVYLSAIWDNTALVPWIRCEPLGEHFIRGTCAAFSHITRKMNNVCIFSHDEVTHDITAVHFSSNYSWSAISWIWTDIDIRRIVKTTAQSVRRCFKTVPISVYSRVDNFGISKGAAPDLPVGHIYHWPRAHRIRGADWNLFSCVPSTEHTLSLTLSQW